MNVWPELNELKMWFYQWIVEWWEVCSPEYSKLVYQNLILKINYYHLISKSNLIIGWALRILFLVSRIKYQWIVAGCCSRATQETLNYRFTYQFTVKRSPCTSRYIKIKLTCVKFVRTWVKFSDLWLSVKSGFEFSDGFWFPHSSLESSSIRICAV